MTSNKYLSENVKILLPVMYENELYNVKFLHEKIVDRYNIKKI